MARSWAGSSVCSSSTYSRQRDTHFLSHAGTRLFPGPHASAQSFIPNFCIEFATMGTTLKCTIDITIACIFCQAIVRIDGLKLTSASVMSEQRSADS